MKSKKFSSQILKLFMILFLILGSGLIVLSSYVLGEELWLKSNTGGKIDRSIWFIHPAEDRPAMAIIKDKYYSNESNEEFSLVVHGVGNMSKLERGAIWEKYNNSVQVEILGEIGSIEEKEGYNAEFETMEPYIKVNLAEKGETEFIWLAIATRYNNTVPIAVKNNSIVVNNSLTLNLPDEKSEKIAVDSTINSDVTFECYTDLFIQDNGSSPFQMATNFFNISKEGNPQDNSILRPLKTFELSGNQLSTKIMGENKTIVWNTLDQRNLIPLLEASQLEPILAQLPGVDAGPWLYFNETDRKNLESRINGSEGTPIYPKIWDDLGSRAEKAMKFDFSDNSVDFLKRRSRYCLDLGFHAWLTQNQTEVNKVVRFLSILDDHIKRIEEDSKMLHHGINLANYILAWDSIQGMINSSSNTLIKEKIRTYSDFVYDYLPDCLDNNWELVVSSGTGLAGLKLHDEKLVHATLEKLEHYISENIRLEGGIYEGQGYIGYAFDSFKRFLMVCARYNYTGLPNYFEDDRLQSVYQFSVRCASPDGYYPLFEDANPGKSGARNGFIMAPFFKNVGESQLATELVWLFKRIGAENNTYPYLEKLIFADYDLESSVPTLPPKYYHNESYSTEYEGASYVAQDSGLAMFRNNWSSKAAYLTTTAKTYEQSHLHKDELGFEFWGNGQKLLAAPGYPGWGFEHHDWTKTTEAVNGGILFSDEGQVHGTTDIGFVQWLRGENVDYIQMKDTHLYGPKHNFLIPPEQLWIIPVAYVVGAIMVGMFIIWNKRKT